MQLGTHNTVVERAKTVGQSAADLDHHDVFGMEDLESASEGEWESAGDV